MAGSGPEAGLLDGVAGVTCLGALPGEAVRQEMGQAWHWWCRVSVMRTFRAPLCEAFGCGLPVIASRIGALAELVRDGETGLLFEPGNAQDLADKMAWAQQHPQQMAQMGRNARALYEAEFTAERNYQQLIAIYHDAIREVKGRDPATGQ